MLWGLVFLAALYFVGSDTYGWAKTGEWRSTTLASSLQFAPDHVFLREWVGLDKIIHYIAYDLPLWVLLIGVAFVLMVFKDEGEATPSQK